MPVLCSTVHCAVLHNRLQATGCRCAVGVRCTVDEEHTPPHTPRQNEATGVGMRPRPLPQTEPFFRLEIAFTKHYRMAVWNTGTLCQFPSFNFKGGPREPGDLDAVCRLGGRPMFLLSVV